MFSWDMKVKKKPNVQDLGTKCSFPVERTGSEKVWGKKFLATVSGTEPARGSGVGRIVRGSQGQNCIAQRKNITITFSVCEKVKGQKIWGGGKGTRWDSLKARKNCATQRENEVIRYDFHFESIFKNRTLPHWAKSLCKLSLWDTKCQPL